MKKRNLLVLPLLALSLAACNGNQKDGDKTPVMAFEASAYSIKLGRESKLNVVNAGSEEIVWTSSDVNKVVVLEDGTIEAIAPGTATITAVCGDKTATCTVTVTGMLSEYALAGINKNANLKTFELNVIDEEDEFRGETSPIIEVGDDNAFDMKPELKIIDKTTLEQVIGDIWDYDYEYSVLEYIDDEYVAPVTAYGTFDAENCTFDFSEEAIGKQFKLSVVPGGIADEKKAQNTTTVEVKVSDGYNVYTAKDLAYFNDVEFDKSYRQDSFGDNYNEAWKAFRKANGLDESYVAPAVFLQSNIKVTKADLPDEFFWKSDAEAGTAPGAPSAVGKMKDSTDVYARYATGFAFNGNYFNVDTTEVPVCGNCTHAGDNISHATLFKVAEKRLTLEEGETADLIFKNCSYFGNAPRGDNQDARLGLIFFKVQNNKGHWDEVDFTVNCTFDNFNVLRACISFYTEYGPTKMTIKDCSVAEGYANGIYLYIHGDVDVINSKLSAFGGPIFVTQGDADATHGFHINADANSILDNFVTGQEPWFVNTGASAAIPLFLQADPSLNQAGKTMKNGAKINIVLLNYGEFPFMSFKKGDTNAIGMDTDQAGMAKMAGLYGEGKDYIMTDGGADLTLKENQIVDGAATALGIAVSNYVDIMHFESSFGFVHFVAELLSLAE